MSKATGTFLSAIKPYIELMRISNPVGSILVYFPHVIGTMFAACYYSITLEVAPQGLLTSNSILLPASFILHATGCSWNDIVDADLDRLVARTKKRPIPRGAISKRNAYLFTAGETLVWLSMLSCISERMLKWTPPMILAVAVYPYAKRLTNYPSLALGATLSYGFFLGCVAVGLDPLELAWQKSRSPLVPMICFFLAYTLLTTSVDMIYAHQDLTDDIKAGILSMAVSFRGRPKTVLGFMAVLQFFLLILAGSTLEFGGLYMGLACGGAATVNAWMIWSVDLQNGQECWWWFQNGAMMMGTALSIGLSAEYFKTRGLL